MKRVVVVNTFKSFREALVTRGIDFAGRSTTSIPMHLQSKGFKGIGSGDYTRTWIFTRKLAYKSMHLFGNGLQNVEEIISDEVDNICSLLKQENGNPVPVKIFFGKVLSLCGADNLFIGYVDYKTVGTFAVSVERFPRFSKDERIC